MKIEKSRKNVYLDKTVEGCSGGASQIDIFLKMKKQQQIDDLNDIYDGQTKLITEVINKKLNIKYYLNSIDYKTLKIKDFEYFFNVLNNDEIEEFLTKCDLKMKNIYGTSLLYNLDLVYNKIDTNMLVKIVKKEIVNFNSLDFKFFKDAKEKLNFSNDNLLDIIDCLPNNVVDNHNLNLLMHYFLMNEKNILPNNFYLTKEKIEKIVKNTNLLHLTNYPESLLTYLVSNINKTINHIDKELLLYIIDNNNYLNEKNNNLLIYNINKNYKEITDFYGKEVIDLIELKLNKKIDYKEKKELKNIGKNFISLITNIFKKNDGPNLINHKKENILQGFFDELNKLYENNEDVNNIKKELDIKKTLEETLIKINYEFSTIVYEKYLINNLEKIILLKSLKKDTANTLSDMLTTLKECNNYLTSIVEEKIDNKENMGKIYKKNM